MNAKATEGPKPAPVDPGPRPSPVYGPSGRPSAPSQLQKIPRWTCWRYRLNNDKTKWTKVPFAPKDTGKHASCNDPRTWGTYEQALSAYDSARGTADPIDGIQLVLTGDDGLVGFDVDDCIKDGVFDEESDLITKIATRSYRTYFEVTPSGTGIRGFAYGVLEKEGNRSGQFEIYADGKLLTVTGNHIEGTPSTVEPEQRLINFFHSRYIAKNRKGTVVESDRVDLSAFTPYKVLDEHEIAARVERMLESANGDKIRGLLDGDDDDYDYDASAADLALCGHLVWWFDGDVAAVYETIWSSRRRREKWNRRDYRERTINLAIQGQLERGGDFYSGRFKDGVWGPKHDEDWPLRKPYAPQWQPPVVGREEMIARQNAIPKSMNNDRGPAEANGHDETTTGASAAVAGPIAGPAAVGEDARRSVGVDDSSLDAALADRNTTDLGNAERLLARYGVNMRYCHPWKKWLVWDATRWKIDDTGLVRRWARNTVRAIAREALTTPENGGRYSKLMKWALDSEKTDRIAAMVKLAEAEPGVPILVSEMNRDPWTFNCSNGTLDLRTGELRPHRREDLITQLCPVEYDPETECPLWLGTLEKFFKRDDPTEQEALIGYWQRICGCAMAGAIRDHILPIAHGNGSNGKSTILETMLNVFGCDYAMKCPPGMLMSKKTETHPTDRADLFGKRLAISIETEHGQNLNETMVKDLTGGGKIKARRMHENFWEFDQTWTLLMATNHKPAIRGTDHAIWRRLKLIPFTVTVQDKDAVKDMPDRLKSEYQGILAWCVRGCAAWQRDGLEPPNEVTLVTGEYRSDQDSVGMFLDECTERGPDFKVLATPFYKKFVEWKSARGERAVTQTAFGVIASERGFTKKASNGIWYLGVRLKE